MRNLTNKRYLLTGGTGTLGAEIALSFCREGAELILPVRNPRKAEQLRSRLLAQYPGACLSFPELDLANEGSVRRLADTLLAQERPLDGLVHNAGIFTQSGRTTAGGEELHMQVNCLSPLLLTRLLLPLLRPADDPIVLTVTSLSAFWHKADRPGASPTGLYAASKRASLQQFVSLAAAEPEILFFFAHPGVCATGLFLSDPRQSAYSPSFLRFALPLMKMVFPSPEKAARCIVHAALFAQGGQLSEPGGPLHIWGKPKLVPLANRLRTLEAKPE